MDVLVSGVETTSQLEDNVTVLKTMTKLSKQQSDTLLQRTKQGKTGSKIEGYKRKEGSAGMGSGHRDGEAG